LASITYSKGPVVSFFVRIQGLKLLRALLLLALIVCRSLNLLLFVGAHRLNDAVLDSVASRVSVDNRTLSRQTDSSLNRGRCHANLLLRLPHFVVNSAGTTIRSSNVKLRLRHILVDGLHHRHGLLSLLRH